MRGRTHFIALLVAAIAVTGLASVAAAQDDAPEVLRAPSSKALHLPPTKPLPPRDCWHCPGPASCPPCATKRPSFLYYGTYPWDDDPVNGFNDCPRGDCGHVGVHRALNWIRFQDQRPRLIADKGVAPLHCTWSKKAP